MLEIGLFHNRASSLLVITNKDGVMCNKGSLAEVHRVAQETLEGLRRHDRNSQLLTLSDQAYQAGLCRLDSELADPSAPCSRADHLCFVTIRGDKPLH